MLYRIATGEGGYTMGELSEAAHDEAKNCPNLLRRDILHNLGHSFAAHPVDNYRIFFALSILFRYDNKDNLTTFIDNGGITCFKFFSLAGEDYYDWEGYAEKHCEDWPI